jgi:hypothetical protein
MADFNTAFAELQAAMQDLNGDGIPDPVVAQEPVNAMAGMREPMSPGMAAIELVRNRAPQEVQNFFSQLPANAAMMAAGPVMGGIGRAVTAYPKVAAGIGAITGLLTSGTEAGAPLTRKQTRQMEMERQRSQMEAEQRRLEIEAETAAAERRGEAEARIATERQRKEAELAEYENQIKRAEMARDTELDRKRRFSETGLGKVYDATGGALPIAAAVGMGAAGRVAHGGGAVGRYVLPALEGAGAALGATSIPLLYDYQTDSDNPEKAAYEAYARELPPSHPRKQEFANYASEQPARNPVQEQAEKNFFSPYRMGMSAVEGALGGLAGSTLAGVPARAFNAMRNWRVPGGGPSTPAAPAVRQDPSGVWRNARGEYASPPKK